MIEQPRQTHARMTAPQPGISSSRGPKGVSSRLTVLFVLQDCVGKCDDELPGQISLPRSGCLFSREAENDERFG